MHYSTERRIVWGGKERGLRRKLQLDKNLRPDVNAMKSELQTSPSVLADTPPLPQRPDVPNSNTSRHSHSSIFLKDDGIRFQSFFFLVSWVKKMTK